jgi:tetratricopeptide (TPR) repeat protein
MTALALFLVKSIALFGYGKLLEKGYSKLFNDENDYKNRLQKVIDNSINEFADDHPIEEVDGKFPFYESQVFMDVLLKYRLFSENKDFDFQSIKSQIAKNDNILIPTQEEIEQFLKIFEKHIAVDEKLIQIYCLKNSDEEIFKISTDFKKQFELLINMDKKLDKIIDQVSHEKKSDKFLTNSPMQDLYIVGRDKELGEITDKLVSDQTVLLMNGLGGIGKTTLARKYILENEGDFDHIVWLEVTQGVVGAFAANNVLHKNLGLAEDIKSLKPEDSFPLIMNNLKNMSGCNLMVLDDATGDFGKIRSELPGKPNWKLLVTSRQEFTGIETYHLDFLKKEDAFLLFYKYYTTEKGDELLKKMFKPVKYHTLVVELFAKMAMMNSLTLSELADKADAEGITISIHTDVNVDHSKENIDNILEYLIRTFPADELPEELIIVLRKLAIMPSGFYDLEYLDFFLQIEEEKKDVFHLCLNKLVKSGWLEKNESEYKMHEIIRQLILKEYPPDYAFYEDYINLLSNISTIDQSKDNPVEKFFIIPFCLNVIENIHSDNELMGYLMKNAASLLSDQGRYPGALEINIKAMAIAERVGSKKLKLNIMTNLGQNYSDLGKYKEARDYMEQGLSAAGEVFGERHQNIAAIQSNLANLYSDLGEYNKARNFLELALKLDLENFGEKHPTVAVRQSNLATVYQDIGEYAKARDLLELALKTNIENFGEKHPAVAANQSNLAIVYKHLGEYTKAFDLLELALKSDMENFGENHPNVAVSQSNLAMVYKDLGEFTKARDLLELALKSDLENFGEKHPNVATDHNNLGGLFLEMKEYDLAWDYFQKALSIAKIVWGEEHPNTLSTINSIEYLVKLMSSNVLAEKGTEVSIALRNINESLGAENVELKQYFEFLEVIIQKGDVQGYFEKLSPEYKKLVEDVHKEIQRKAFWEELKKFTVMAIKTHNGQEDFLEEILLHISKLGEDIHPEVRKYYDFLLGYAEGEDAEVLKDTIYRSLWEMFIEIRDGGNPN